MSTKIQFKRGSTTVPTLLSGEPALQTGTNSMYIGSPSGNVLINTLGQYAVSDNIQAYIVIPNFSGVDFRINTDKSQIGLGGFACGSGTSPTGRYGVSTGLNTSATGNNSFSAGERSRANVNCMTAIGVSGNLGSGTPNTVSATNDLFIVGNGTITDGGVIGDASNAFRVNASGKVYAENGIYGTGADLAEMFEWFDGNPSGEDRVGYFVKLNNSMIEYATSSSDEVLGVTSSTPMILGNTASEHWHGKYVKDDFGRYEYTVSTDEEGNNVYTRQISMAFDPNLTYVPREHRPEWVSVGFVGRVPIRDDGTCTIGGYCQPSTNGIATTATYGYRVLKRISANVIEILFNQKSSVIDGSLRKDR